MRYRNHEHYADPTAGEALERIMRERRAAGRRAYGPSARWARMPEAARGAEPGGTDA